VAIEVDLQPEWCPGRNAHVAQPELLVDEVEVVMQALAGGGLEEGAMGVAPWKRMKFSSLRWLPW
jgi:hypothetical protein